MFPSLHCLPIAAPKVKRGERGESGESGEKRSRPLARPCHDELRYADGETVNRNPDRRVQGGSAKFTRVEDRTPEHKLIFSTALETWKAIESLNPYTHSWERVLAELYSDRTPTSPSQAQREGGKAYVVRYDNDATPQYYIHTLKDEATLFHIKPDGDFWSYMYDESADTKTGDLCYTNGFVWTNPNPRWQWKSGHYGERIMRVNINIPAGTQVIIDRSPVYGGTTCELEKGRVSLFPDVLLGPAEFLVKRVVRYRSNTELLSGATKEPDVRYVDPLKMWHSRDGVYDDLEYAGLMVFDADEFIDVTVDMMRQVKLPEVGSIKVPDYISG